MVLDVTETFFGYDGNKHLDLVISLFYVLVRKAWGSFLIVIVNGVG